MAPGEGGRSPFSAGFLAAFALVPPIVAVLVSVLVRPVFNPRYLVEAAVPTLLLAGAALASVPFRAARSVLAAAAATCCVWAAADQLAWPTRIAWGELVAAMRSPRCLGGDGSAPVYVLGRAAPRPVSYYLERVKSSQRVVPISSLDEIAPRSGSLAFHSGSDLAGRAYFSPMRREAVLAALEARGLRVLCEETSGPSGRQGVVVSFAPVGAAP